MTPSPAEREKGPALRLLILGGTTEASALAHALAGRPDIAPLLSLAGRTESPAAPPIPHRIGGFGGIDGLSAFLNESAIEAVVDATHPFAARISANAVAACRQVGAPLAAYTRPAWRPAEGDDWHAVPDIEAAVRALDDHGQANDPGQWSDDAPSSLILSRVRSTRVEGRTALQFPPERQHGSIERPSTRPLRGRLRMRNGVEPPLRVFLTTGRLDLAGFRAAPQHHYVIRTIDPPDPAALPPGATVVLARPPFTAASETALMKSYGIDLLVTKNSGGSATTAKLTAARDLGMPVLMVDRPAHSGALEFHHLDDVLAWIAEQRRRP